MWNNYTEITPTVAKIKSILGLSDHTIFTDHLAYRSINTAHFGIDRLSQPFEELGFKIKKFYYFKEKKLRAVHLEHNVSKNSPKIFISELLMNEFSPFLNKTLLHVFNRIDSEDKDILTSGRNWDVQYRDYKRLAMESEYASWLYIHGIRVNHFTLDVNRLKNYTLKSLCYKLKKLGVNLNQYGGIIKGDKSKGLSQASTMADEIFVKFEDLQNELKIPSCYVEFAERHKINNHYFNGFLVNSADKIFESTNNSFSN
jgi:hypothetical protein